MNTDEDTLTIPREWRRHLHARRGGTPGPGIRVGAPAVRAVREMLDGIGGAFEALVAGRAGDPALAEAARLHLEGDPGPVGAAAVATVAAGTVGRDRRARTHRAFVDAWAAEHGAGFAACAVVELSTMIEQRGRGGPWNDRWLGVSYRKSGFGGTEREAVRRARCLLAALDDDAHADAVERLGGHRRKPAARWLVSYLVPERRDWLEECLRFRRVLPSDDRWLLYCSLDDPALLGDPPPDLGWRETSRGLLATMTDAMGAGLLPFLVHNIDGGRLTAQETRQLYETVAVLPVDEAFQALLDRRADRNAVPALVEAMNRFPVRAMRLLAAAGADELLRDHVQGHPEVLPALPGELRAAVERFTSRAPRVPDAPPDALPAFLADLPWTRPVKPLAPDLKPPAGTRIAWRDGEREEWLAAEAPPMMDDPHWAALARGYRRGGPDRLKLQLLLYGPEEIVRPILAGWDADGPSENFGNEWARPLIARYGLDAYPMALHHATEHPARDHALLLPFLDAEVAALMAGWLRQEGKGTALTARAWLDRHGLDAVPRLAPAALAKPAAARRNAEAALRHIAAAHGTDPVADAVPEAADGLRALLTAHPAQTGLAPRPRTAGWLNLPALPQPLLRGRGQALPHDAVRTLLELLSLPVPYGRDAIREACDPASLAEFGWALLERWRAAGHPARDGWALAQLGTTGDDGTVDRLLPVVHKWPGARGHAKAVRGLDVFVALGSDTALAALYDVAERSRFGELRGEARDRFERAAAERGLTADQLGDRLVPAFGMDGGGALVLDYGPRRFTVGFDDQFRPQVADEDGTPRKSPPKPAKKDDPDLAPAAYRAFADLKKNVRTVAAHQRDRLERAMPARRRWSPDEFRDLIIGHPLVWHLARRLVWLAEDGGAAAFFRVAEDRTFADVHDDAYDLPDTARVGIAHPVQLGGDLKAWAEVLADYEILQPFPQLDHPFVALDPEQRSSGVLTGLGGAVIDSERLYRLTYRGWAWTDEAGEAYTSSLSRRIAGDHRLIALFGAADRDAAGYRLREVRVVAGDGSTGPHFGELDPVALSEALITLPLGPDSEGT
ncbi:DUF4132 domain-containing protein [Spirillospora albida]|uniref:DUF4132 domain-containing protein n=1 Tax=Spirillospora albida TaxID=58123 RepID=UPI00068FF9A1|nr:DUF4132 domain-containing protein [Spirillospora albida]